jgi:hypothetical protein
MERISLTFALFRKSEEVPAVVLLENPKARAQAKETGLWGVIVIV